MKPIFTLILLLNIFYVNAQEMEPTNTGNRVFILDKYWKTRSATKFPTDGRPSFLSITDGVVTLFSRSRDKSFAYESRVLEWEVSMENDVEIITFLGERNYINATRPSFEIKIESTGNVAIHIFHTLGGNNQFFSGHVALEEELDEVFSSHALIKTSR